MTSMRIPDRWLIDLQLIDGSVQMELSIFAEEPAVGTALTVERYGTWEVLGLLRPATPYVGSLLEVRLLTAEPVS